MAKSRNLLPKKAPKKTGKKGIGPKEFDGDLVEQDQQRQEKENTEGVQVTEQGSSLLVEQPKKPTVVGKLFEAFMMKPAFYQTKKGKRFIDYRFTVELTKEHDDVIPELIAARHKDAVKKGSAGVILRDVPAQNVGIFLANDMQDPAIELDQCQVLDHSRINIILKKGEGTARRVVRLTIAFRLALTKERGYFAEQNFNNHFWLKLSETQPDLLELEDDEDKS